MNRTSEAFCFLALIGIMITVLLGCCDSVRKFSIPVKVDSQIDLEQYNNLVVLPFTAIKSGNMLANVPADTGNEIALALRYQLGRRKGLNVISTQDTFLMLDGRTSAVNTLARENIDRIISAGDYMDVDAVVGGDYDFYAVSQPRRAYSERYSRTLQRYVTYYQDYLEKTYVFSLQIRILDVATKEFVWDELYNRRASEAHSLGSMIISEVAPTNSILKNLVQQALRNFIRETSPHYETEYRFLAH